MDTRLLLLCGGLLLLGLCLTMGACTIFHQARFGTLPQDEELTALQASSHYHQGAFHYPIPTPVFSQDVGVFSVLWTALFQRHERATPLFPIPTRKTDLKALDRHQDVVVWLGHSSWFIQLAGIRILIDPVLSDHAAPFSFLNKAYAGTTLYRADEIPDIDCLLISHDHWDHLDYATIMALQARVHQVFCPLGVDNYFKHWQYPVEKIMAGDWYDQWSIHDKLTISLLPARHYSGRLLSKNKTLWAGFALHSANRSILYSGDSGYGPHFSAINKVFPDFDLVLLDCGQYDPRWAAIHMTPEEASQAAAELQAQTLIPTHVGRFTLANHAWDAPFRQLHQASKGKAYHLVTPTIGVPVPLATPSVASSLWWQQGGAENPVAPSRETAPPSTTQ